MPTTANVFTDDQHAHLGHMARRHKSQFIYDGMHADDRPLALSPLDIERFKMLARFPFLPSNWIHALTGGNEQRSYSRLARLARDPHRYLERKQAWFKHAVYKLSDKGYAAINATPDLSRDPFSHQLLQSVVEASLALEIKDADHLGWSDIVALGKVPFAAINSRTIPLAMEKLSPDGRPCALRRGSKHLFFIKEIDRSTEPLVSSIKRRSIEEKFQHYAEFISRGVYRSHFGFPNCVVLFITTSEVRMNSMMRLAKHQIGDATWLMFTHTKDWANELHYPAPPLDFYTRAWKRNGHPEFFLNRFDA